MAHRMTSVHPLNRRECTFPPSKRYLAQLKGAVEDLSEKNKGTVITNFVSVILELCHLCLYKCQVMRLLCS